MLNREADGTLLLVVTFRGELAGFHFRSPPQDRYGKPNRHQKSPAKTRQEGFSH